MAVSGANVMGTEVTDSDLYDGSFRDHALLLELVSGDETYDYRLEDDQTLKPIKFMEASLLSKAFSTGSNRLKKYSLRL